VSPTRPYRRTCDGHRAAARQPAPQSARAAGGATSSYTTTGDTTLALCVRTIGIARARVKIGLANLTYNIRRLIHHERIAAKA
jgi:hypothetical protein